MTNKYDGLIFDLDGTLWDSTSSVAKAWQTAKEKVGYVKENVTQADVRAIAGMAYDAIYEKLFPSLDEEQRKAFMEVSGKEELEHMYAYGGVLYDELESTLQYLQTKYRLFIVSNCQSGYIEAFLKFHNMEKYFEDHQCFGTKNRPKDENIRDVVERNDLKSPVYIGDTLGDYKASVGAKVPFIFAAYGFGKVESGQVATIEKFSDLKNIL
ncbi:HAD family hydrolase [Pontibacter silvestris]|uniref:phosphoglycolate phosphatase n=1 Tax=Pontibacter silvestris TaxID=2305183 RepID=A0ABW4WRR0_9BACT|nr:HAD family hydrolase [Pontibacter silvestris]MCC9136174.1 HAD family hydrolase [Pontibacter silvestris]